MTLLVSPAPRWNAVMAELPASSELVLFGGKTTAGLNSDSSLNQLFNDTWKWDGTAWTRLLVSGPSARSESAMAFDGTYVTLVGGTDGHVNLSDTWSYNTAGGWVQQALSNAISLTGTYSIPTTLRGAAMAYQSGISGGTDVLFGGTASYQTHYVLDTWKWATGSPGTWTELSPAAFPSARIYPAMASSAATAVLFGGKNFDGGLSDTWKWDGTIWTRTATTQTPGVSSPSARYGACMAYDASSSQYVLFGGVTANGYNNETWTFSTGTNTWTQQTTGPVPMGRAFSVAAYLTANTTVMMFGGLAYDRDLNDTWVWNGTVWAQS